MRIQLPIGELNFKNSECEITDLITNLLKMYINKLVLDNIINI